MKIKEAVNIINSTKAAAATTNHDNLQIYDLLIDNKLNWFITMPIKAISWKDVSFDWHALEGVLPADLARVMDVIQRLLDTPVEERFPEKKYHLRWIDDSYGAKSYVGLHLPTVNYQKASWYMTTMLENKENNYKELWSESELEQLKKNNPRLAPAIDAMKEPAEDKDNEN